LVSTTRSPAERLRRGGGSPYLEPKTEKHALDTPPGRDAGKRGRKKLPLRLP